jgi:malonate decarboxylase beta subunit
MSNAQDSRLNTNFVEQGARKRIEYVLDSGSMRELVTPFDRVISPWLEVQGIVPQFDDGVVVARGAIDGKSVIAIAIDGSFQGGSLGEVAGAKIAGALELAVEANQAGESIAAVLMFETGGVRLQEANLGLAAIAEIQSAIVALRKLQPVVALITGPVGCFGGMSITAGLCSYLLMTREGRLGLNGPQVIEQEAGVGEYDSRDRPFIWGLTGGEQRYTTGLVDDFFGSDVIEVRNKVQEYFRKGVPDTFRSEAIQSSLDRLKNVDTQHQITSEAAREIFAKGASL